MYKRDAKISRHTSSHEPKRRQELPGICFIFKVDPSLLRPIFSMELHVSIHIAADLSFFEVGR